MIVFPAVDIKDGQCVRLRQGLADQVTVFGDDPAAMARHWAAQGARYLHVVDLDGAFSGQPRNFELIRTICDELDIPVQLGGGIRDLDTAKAYIRAGVTRLIIGTMALENPELFGELCAALPGRIGVSLDAVDGRLKTKGWVQDAGQEDFDVLPRRADRAPRFSSTPTSAATGMQTGVNVAALVRLAWRRGCRRRRRGRHTWTTSRPCTP